jgi:hypothetical protein
MKKWIEGWLVPLVNRFADTPAKKRVVYVILAIVGLLMAWFGVSVTRVSVDQLMVLDQTPLGQGALK